MFDLPILILLPVPGTNRSVILSAAGQGIEVLIEDGSGDTHLVLDFSDSQLAEIAADVTVIAEAINALIAQAEHEAEYLEAHDETGQGEQ